MYHQLNLGKFLLSERGTVQFAKEPTFSTEAGAEDLTTTAVVPRSRAPIDQYNPLCRWPSFESRDSLMTTGPFPALKSGLVCTGNATVETRLYVLDSRSTVKDLVKKGLGVEVRKEDLEEDEGEDEDRDGDEE